MKNGIGRRTFLKQSLVTAGASLAWTSHEALFRNNIAIRHQFGGNTIKTPCGFRTMKHPFLATFSLVLLGTLLCSAKAETYSYADLVGRLTDLKALAAPPLAGEKTGLASSYDRKSQYDAAKDKYISWDANADGTGIVRREGNDAVLAEIQGPGCIYRTWSAMPKAGHVKIYLDGSTTPAVDLPFTAYFDGSQEPFNRPSLVYKTHAEGYNNFTPIPFQKSCKIVAENDWGKYYHFNYTQFPLETVVPTFHLPLPAADTAALDRANNLLLHSGQNPYPKVPSDVMERKQITAEPGKTTVVLDQSGPGAITGIRVKFNLPTEIEVQRALLRQLALRITWDNQSQPAVWSPLGDFFGSPVAAIPFDSLTTGMGKDGYCYSYWYMPFGAHATMSIDNDGATALPMDWEITRTQLTQKTDSLLRFHAKWHRDAFLPARPDRKIDWTLLTTQGKGRYVGAQLHIWNPRDGWWGEGDEKFFVDGEKFPSTFGTGSEDYFGYAWGSPRLFSAPFHGQTYTENATHGHTSSHTSNFRWHISDNIPFQTRFEGAIEKYFPNERPTLYAAVAYWYLDPSGTDPYPVVPVSERAGYCIPQPVYHAPNAIEAELLRETNLVRDIHNTSGVNAAGLGIPVQVVSNDAFLEVGIKEVGQNIKLSGVKVQNDGKYKLQARVFKSMVSGIYQFSLDGTPVGIPVDLYSSKKVKESAMTSDPLIDLGTTELTAGMHVLSIALVGKNESAKEDVLFGSKCNLDYFKLEPVQ